MTMCINVLHTAMCNATRSQVLSLSLSPPCFVHACSAACWILTTQLFACKRRAHSIESVHAAQKPLHTHSAVAWMSLRLPIPARPRAKLLAVSWWVDGGPAGPAGWARARVYAACVLAETTTHVGEYLDYTWIKWRLKSLNLHCIINGHFKMTTARSGHASYLPEKENCSLDAIFAHAIFLSLTPRL